MVNYRYCPQCKNPMVKHETNPYCRICDLTIYNNPAPTVGVFPVKNGQVLLSKRGIAPFKGYLDTIGGFVDPGETLEEAAIREVKEETGLRVRLLKLLGSYTDTYSESTQVGVPILAFNYVAKVVGDDTKMKPMDDVASLHWYPIENIPINRMSFSAHNQTIKDLQNWYKQNS